MKKFQRYAVKPVQRGWYRCVIKPNSHTRIVHTAQIHTAKYIGFEFFGDEFLDLGRLAV